MATIDATAEPTTLVLQAGDDVVLTLAENPAVSTTWAGYHSWFAQVRASDRPTATAVTLTVDDTNQASGTIVLLLPKSVTTVVGSKWRWQVRALDASNNDVTLIRGSIIVEANDAIRP